MPATFPPVGVSPITKLPRLTAVWVRWIGRPGHQWKPQTTSDTNVPWQWDAALSSA